MAKVKTIGRIWAEADIGLHRRPYSFAGVTTSLIVLLAAREWFVFGGSHVTYVLPGRLLVLSFMFGVFFFLMKDRVTIRLRYVIPAFLAYALLINSSIGLFFVAPFVAYVTVAMGLWNQRFDWLIKISNYSYGVYLYGFPVQQVVSSLFPHQRIWWFNFGVSLPAAFLLGALSWHGLELKVAQHKKVILTAIHRPLSLLRGRQQPYGVASRNGASASAGGGEA